MGSQTETLQVSQRAFKSEHIKSGQQGGYQRMYHLQLLQIVAGLNFFPHMVEKKMISPKKYLRGRL